jgi:hypothetical protein
MSDHICFLYAEGRISADDPELRELFKEFQADGKVTEICDRLPSRSDLL